jgi:hypothetical protein
MRITPRASDPRSFFLASKDGKTMTNILVSAVLPLISHGARSSKDKVDVVKLIEARRKLLKPQDGYLDALWEVAQAEADLVAAVGDPEFAVALSLTAKSNKAALAPKP